MFIIKDTRKKVKRKEVTFKAWPKRVLGKRKVEKQDKGRGSASVNVRQLEDQNKHLADALNKAKSQITILQNQIRDTRDQNLDLRVENATQRDEIRRLKDGCDVSVMQRQVELDMQQKLQTYLEPMRKSLHKALGHTEGLTTSLSQTMQFTSALDRKSKSIQSSPFTNQQTRASPSKQPTADSSSDITIPAYKKPASSVAQILPMVKGHPISQPKIKMSRVLMNTEEIESLQRQHSSRVEESEDDEEGPSVTNSEEDDEEEVTNRQQHQRQLRLRNLENRPLADLSDLVEEEEEEEEEDSDEGDRRVTPRLVLDTVLIPRLVLDRVAVPENPVRSPHKRRRSSPVKREILQQRRRKRSRASIDGQRFEASSDVMSPRVMIRDDAHELMSKINNSSCDDTAPANLTNPYGDWSLPSTPDESGVDVTLDEEEAESTSSASTASSKTEEAKLTGQQQQKAAAPLTPGGSRETQTQFLERVMSLDPMEGPSWLYDDNNKKRRAPPKSKKTKTNSTGKSNQNVSEETRTTAIQTSNSSEKSSRPVSDEPQTISIQASGSSSSELPARPSDEDESRRGRRRAAAAALGSLKEPSANKKLRQGDQNSSSIYTDFVPGTKAHSGTSNRRTTSMGGSQPATKRQSLHKKRSK